jgi:hypothetical protein
VVSVGCFFTESELQATKTEITKMRRIFFIKFILKSLTILTPQAKKQSSGLILFSKQKHRDFYLDNNKAWRSVLVSKL